MACSGAPLAAAKRRRPVLGAPLVSFPYGHGRSELFYTPVYGRFVPFPPHCGSPPPIASDRLLRSSSAALSSSLLLFPLSLNARPTSLPITFPLALLCPTAIWTLLLTSISHLPLPSILLDLLVLPLSLSLSPSYNVLASYLVIYIYTRWLKLMVCCSLNPTVQCLSSGTSPTPSSCVL